MGNRGRGVTTVSAILPVKNRAHHLPELVARLRAQSCDAALELIAVDSGSTDHSVSVLKELGCTVLAVDPPAFDYGLTRNAAVEFAEGEFLLFISTTMLPLDRQWLQPLLERMRESEDLAGVYSRGIPSPGSDLLNARDYLRADLLTNRPFFPEVTGSSDPFLRRIAEREAYDRLSPEQRRQFISFSNVSSLVRASVFRSHPFVRVDSCGEDMLWARTVLEAGYSIRYEPRSVVIYSHDYTDDDLFRRSFDDAAGNRRFAGVGFDASAVLPTIRCIVRDDWRYLRQARGAVPDLERETLQAGLRRVLQVAAQWLGANWNGSSDADLRVLLQSLKWVEGGEDLFRSMMNGASDGPPIAEPTITGLREAVRAAWDGMLMRSEEQMIDEMLRVAATYAGRWLAAQAPGGDLRARFSLIESIRRGYRTGDMTPAKIAPRSGDPPAPFSGPSDWTADVDALRAVVQAHEHEFFAAHQELENRARAMESQNAAISDLQRLMSETVAIRDRQIRELQAELHEKVAVRDTMISQLQQEMQAKVLDCNRIIQDLQRQIASAGNREATGEEPGEPVA